MPAFADGDDQVVPGQVVVRLQPGANLGAFLQRYDVSSLDSVASTTIHLISVIPGDEEEFVDDLELDADVLWAEPNYTGRDLDPDPDTQSIFVAGTYNGYINQPSMGVIRQPQAQQLATGLGVVVAVLDSGIDPLHPILSSSITPGGWNYVDDNGDLRDIGDGLDSNNNGTADEMVGHGTLVAGLVLRVAPDAMILPIKVLDSDGLTTTFTLVKGIYHAVSSGAQVVNISMGSTIDTQVLTDALAAAQLAGVLIIASAGNEDTSSPVRFPAGAASSTVLAVAATHNNDERALFSNFGEHISLCAPGVMLTSTIPGGGFGRASGTSFAAPLVAGGAALVIERTSNDDPAAAALALRLAARPISVHNSGYEELLGTGRLDLQRALLRWRPTGLLPAGGQGPQAAERVKP
jgi:subtilisin family serine protease